MRREGGSRGGEGKLTLEPHFTTARSAIAAARAAPLSRKKAMLAALLVDAAADAAFRTSGEDDVLAFRARLAAGSEALALAFALCAMDPHGPRLVTEAVEVPVEDYPELEVEDFMVSLYNGRTVMRVISSSQWRTRGSRTSVPIH